MKNVLFPISSWRAGFVILLFAASPAFGSAVMQKPEFNFCDKGQCLQIKGATGYGTGGNAGFMLVGAEVTRADSKLNFLSGARAKKVIVNLEKNWAKFYDVELNDKKFDITVDLSQLSIERLIHL